MPQMDANMEIVSQHAPFDQNQPPTAVDALPKSASTPSLSDSGKKKRGHRAAKLKQCKMDARREQWLAQVSGKLNKSENSVANHTPTQCDKDDKQDSKLLKSDTAVKTLDTTRSDSVNSDVSLYKDMDGKWSKEQVLNPKDAKWPQEQVLKPKDLSSHFQIMSLVSSTKESHPASEAIASDLSKTNSCQEEKAADEMVVNSMSHLDMQEFSSRWSSSDMSSSMSNSSRFSSSSGGSGSGSDDENEIEDWEVVADALDVQDSVQEKSSECSDQSRSPEQKRGSLDLDKCILKPENKFRPGNCGSRMRADSSRAWRPDDVSRPQTLPRLSKQNSFPIQSGASMWGNSHGCIWGLPPAPSHCPICTEELDTTDSSFIPCSCGFRLCLFCHHRIVIGDGRCPGCRRSYNLEASLKLSRTCSARPRI